MLPQFTASDIERFWKKVAVGAPDECWPWIASLGRQGYGQFRVQNRVAHSHRVALFLATGIDRDDAMGLHSCDNPPCCNPGHLRYGTAQENAADMIERGRWNPVARFHLVGSALPFAKVTESDVAEIRRLKANGATYPELSARYGITPGSLCDICKRRNWKHVP